MISEDRGLVDKADFLYLAYHLPPDFEFSKCTHIRRQALDHNQDEAGKCLGLLFHMWRLIRNFNVGSTLACPARRTSPST